MGPGPDDFQFVRVFSAARCSFACRSVKNDLTPEPEIGGRSQLPPVLRNAIAKLPDDGASERRPT